MTYGSMNEVSDEYMNDSLMHCHNDDVYFCTAKMRFCRMLSKYDDLMNELAKETKVVCNRS